MKYEIKNRYTGKIQFTADIDCSDDTPDGVKKGLAAQWAYSNVVPMDLCNFDGARFVGARFVGASFDGAIFDDKSLASLGACFDIPKIENIHQTIYAAALVEGAFSMRRFHSNCGTTHCRAGHATHQCGSAGVNLEDMIGTDLAARLIYKASDPSEYALDFYCDDKKAMAEMAKMAGLEAANNGVMK